MKTKILMSGLLVGVAIILLSFDLPKGWFKAGSDPKSYDMGVDKGAGHDGKNAATIKSIDKKIKGFGTLMQHCLPDKYLGKRVRLSGYIKSKDVSDWAGFWIRIDQKEGMKNNMQFDNMHDGKKDRSIKGTTSWAKYEIVLDVPLTSSLMAYGALVSGTGQIWFDDLSIDIVDKSIETTGMNNTDSAEPYSPVNLDFRE